MTAFLWRALFAVVVIVLITQNILLWHSSDKISEPSIPLPATAHRPASTNTESQTSLAADTSDWTYEPLRDAENFALHREQCDAAFPGLWFEIDRGVSVWKNDLARPITANDTSLEWREEGAFRALIHRNQLRILETKGIFSIEGSQFPERTVAVWQQIHRALLGATAAGETLPTIEFSVSVDDRPNTPEEDPNDTHTLWSFSRRYENPAHDRAFVMPDFNFWSWRGVAGSFTEMRARGKELDEYIPDKIPKAVWRGVVWTNPDVRAPLLKATKNKDWADVVEFDWMTRANYIPMEEFCRYAFLVHTEGRSWSGRLKYLLNCDSVTMIHEREWTAHYYSLLVPDGPKQNFVPLKRNFSDLKSKVKHYLNDQNAAQKIADNAVATFRDRYLTLSAEACYWRKLIEGWNEVADTPEVYENVQKNISGKMESRKMLRGIAFEELVTYALRNNAEWPPAPKEPEEEKGDADEAESGDDKEEKTG
ncbi:hypothetical protein Q7P37_004641 [Cladosporium fusiforme]